jgi:hypothetical protein
VSPRVKEERNVLHTIIRRTVTSIGHILRRNCLLKYVLAGRIEGRLEVMGRRGRRLKQLLDDLKQRKGCRKLKEDVLVVDRTVWKIGFARGCGLSVSQAKE